MVLKADSVHELVSGLLVCFKELATLVQEQRGNCASEGPSTLRKSIKHRIVKNPTFSGDHVRTHSKSTDTPPTHTKRNRSSTTGPAPTHTQWLDRINTHITTRNTPLHPPPTTTTTPYARLHCSSSSSLISTELVYNANLPIQVHKSTATLNGTGNGNGSASLG